LVLFLFISRRTRIRKKPRSCGFPRTSPMGENRAPQPSPAQTRPKTNRSAEFSLDPAQDRKSPLSKKKTLNNSDLDFCPWQGRLVIITHGGKPAGNRVPGPRRSIDGSSRTVFSAVVPGQIGSPAPGGSSKFLAFSRPSFLPAWGHTASNGRREVWHEKKSNPEISGNFPIVGTRLFGKKTIAQ